MGSVVEQKVSGSIFLSQGRRSVSAERRCNVRVLAVYLKGLDKMS